MRGCRVFSWVMAALLALTVGWARGDMAGAQPADRSSQTAGQALMETPGQARTAAGDASQASGPDAGVPLFTLEDALALALQQAPSVVLDDLALEQARLDYEETKANQMLSPSVITMQQAEDAWRAAQRNRELARQSLMLRVEEAYYSVLRAQMALDLAERTLQQAQAQLESTRARHEQGMLSLVDLLAAESQVASAELEVNRAQANLATARMNFNRVIGRELEAPFQLVDEMTYEPVPVDLEEAVAHALQVRLELERARDTVELRRKQVEVYDNPYTPQITLQRARLALEQAQVQLAEQTIDIVLEVRQNYQSLREAEARVPIQRNNLNRALESLRISEARYEAGVITFIDLIDAQRNAFQAETQLIQAIFDYNTALARFFQSAGYPLEARREAVSQR